MVRVRVRVRFRVGLRVKSIGVVVDKSRIP